MAEGDVVDYEIIFDYVYINSIFNFSNEKEDKKCKIHFGPVKASKK